VGAVLAISLLAGSAFALLGAYSRSSVRLWWVEGDLLTRVVKFLLLEKITAVCGQLTAAYSTRALVGAGLGLGIAGGGSLVLRSKDSGL